MNYDSILVATDSTTINRSEFCHTGKTVPDQDIPMVGRSYCALTDDYLLLSLILMGAAMAILLYRRRQVLLFRLKTFLSGRRNFSTDIGNPGVADVYDNFLLVSISAISLSVVFFEYLSVRVGFSQIMGIPYWILGISYVVLLLFLYARAWIHALIGWTFFRHDSSVAWMSSYLFLNASISFVIFPVSLLLYFDAVNEEIVMWLYLFVLFLYEIIICLKLILNFKTKKFGSLLIFLYFCSVELLPALVLVQFFRSTAIAILQTFILN